MISTQYFPPVKEDGDFIEVPLIDQNRYVKFKWAEGEGAEDFFERHGKWKSYPYDSFCVWSQQEGNEETPSFEVFSYEMKTLDDEIVFLVSLSRIGEFDDMLHTICIPFNRFSLIKFYKENLLPFCGKDFIRN